MLAEESLDQDAFNDQLPEADEILEANAMRTTALEFAKTVDTQPLDLRDIKNLLEDQQVAIMSAQRKAMQGNVYESPKPFRRNKPRKADK
jgi:hypothetical protein